MDNFKIKYFQWSFKNIYLRNSKFIFFKTNMLLKTIFSSLLLLQIVSLKIPIKYLKYASNNKNIPNKVKNKILAKLFLFKNELENLS